MEKGEALRENVVRANTKIALVNDDDDVLIVGWSVRLGFALKKNINLACESGSACMNMYVRGSSFGYLLPMLPTLFVTQYLFKGSDHSLPKY